MTQVHKAKKAAAPLCLFYGCRYAHEDDFFYEPSHSPYGYGRSSAYERARNARSRSGFGGYGGGGSSRSSDPSKCHLCGTRNYARDCSQARCKQCCDDVFCPRH